MQIDYLCSHFICFCHKRNVFLSYIAYLILNRLFIPIVENSWTSIEREITYCIYSLHNNIYIHGKRLKG